MLGLAATSHPRRLEDKVWLNIEGGKERIRKISSEIILEKSGSYNGIDFL